MKAIFSNKQPYERALASSLLVLMLMFFHCESLAQDKQLIQIKTFDHQMKSVGNVSVSINGKTTIKIETKGVAFAEIESALLPPKTIEVTPEEYEAESWNFSKGVLEIILRKKNYRLYEFSVRSTQGNLPSNLTITYTGKKTIEVNVTPKGIARLPIPNEDYPLRKEQLALDGFTVVNVVSNERDNIIVIEPVKKIDKKTKAPAQRLEDQYFKDFDLKNLDSIRSLTVFYAVFKNYQISDLPAGVKQRIDRKFMELVNELQAPAKEERFIGKISDSSFVDNDISNLLAQARLENKTLDDLRADFDQKIKVIQNKLASDQNLDPETRRRLLDDINLLESILMQNEEKFYRNLEDYRTILSSLKASYFDTKSLEEKLQISESQRLEEQEKVRRVTLITFSFALLIILLIYLGLKLRRQKGSLELANNEIKHINENLETLVYERTKLLEEAHREMDVFLYRASHDLRSPICSIIGLCNIATLLDASAQKELFDRVNYTAQKMDRMLKKLRIISEINQPSNYSLVVLRKVLDDIQKDFDEFINLQQIQYIVDCDPNISFRSYPQLIETILYNLIDNAIFFSSLKGNSKIQLKAASPMASFTSVFMTTAWVWMNRCRPVFGTCSSLVTLIQRAMGWDFTSFRNPYRHFMAP